MRSSNNAREHQLVAMVRLESVDPATGESLYWVIFERLADLEECWGQHWYRDALGHREIVFIIRHDHDDATTTCARVIEYKKLKEFCERLSIPIVGALQSNTTEWVRFLQRYYPDKKSA